VALKHLTVKEAPNLESVSGIRDLPNRTVLGIFLARRLGEIGDVADRGRSLRELELEDRPGIDAIDDVESLGYLRFLSISECGDIASLAPVGSLKQLETLYAWGSTRIVDADLSPLAQLPRLKEIRMRNRRGYKPPVSDLVSALSARASA
jgi:hypothetical protein